MKKIIFCLIVGVVFFAPFFVFAATPERGDINFVFDDCVGVAYSCKVWTQEEKTSLLNFLYGVGKPAPDDALTGAYQIIKSIIGLPYGRGRVVKLTYDPTSRYEAYYSFWDNRIVFKGTGISGISVGDAGKRRLSVFGHELVHAFHGTALMVSGFEEGAARMVERILEKKLDVGGDQTDFFFSNYDQNNDMDMGFKDGNLFRGILGLSGNTYSLVGAAFTKLYYEDPLFWARFHDSMYNAYAADASSIILNANKLVDILKSVGPAEVEGIPLNEWISRQAGLNYSPASGPALILNVDSNLFLYVYYIYRDPSGSVTQQFRDPSSGYLLSVNSANSVVTAQYFDSQGGLIKTEVLNASSWLGFFDPYMKWLSNMPLDRREAIRVVVEFKIVPANLVLREELLIPSVEYPGGGINGVVASSFVGSAEGGKVLVSRLSGSVGALELPVSRGGFYTDTNNYSNFSRIAPAESLEGPLLLRHRSKDGVELSAVRVNKSPGLLTVLFDNHKQLVTATTTTTIVPVVTSTTTSTITPVVTSTSTQITGGNAPVFSLYAPVSGESIVLGKPYTIRWQMTSGNSSAVRLSLYKSGGYKTSIAIDVPNTGSYFWSVPMSLPEGLDYFIRLFDLAYPNNYYDGPKFSLVSQGAAISTTTQTTATTTPPTVFPPTATSTPGASLNPDLAVYNFSLQPNKSAYNKSEPFGIDVVLKNIGSKDSGSFIFSVRNKTNGWDMGWRGLSLAPGESHSFNMSWSSMFWASEGYNLVELKVDSGNTVVELNESNNYTTFGVLVSGGSVSASANTTTVTASPTTATAVSPQSSPAPTTSTTSMSPISSTTATATSTSGTSSGSTTTTTQTQIAPKFSISAPAAAANLAAGSNYNITWQMLQGNSSTVRLSLYQNGSFKDFIVADTANDGSYQWTVPGSVGSGYSIRVFDLAYPNNYADSGQFSIIASSASASIAVLASIINSVSAIINQLAEEIKNLRR